jgi:hypothetical protein
MRLADLNPRWRSTGFGRKGMGVSFECPHCRDILVGVWFVNPIDGGPPFRGTREDGTPELLWSRTGETFDTLSTSPSIDVSARGHWHGFITNGEAA